MLLPYILLTSLFARGGGGGSSGGGGGGGSGGGGHGGSVAGLGTAFLVFFVAFIGFMPIFFLGNMLQKHQGRLRAHLVTWAAAVLYGYLGIRYFKGWGIELALLALIGAVVSLFDLLSKMDKTAKIEAVIDTLSAEDKKSLLQFAADTFLRFQTDWSKADVTAMQQYMTPGYYYHNQLMMMALAQAGRRNDMSDVNISDQFILSAAPGENGVALQATVQFRAQAKDQLVNIANQKVLFTDTNAFTEYWVFEHSPTGWLLAGIEEASADYNSANLAVQQFAQSYKFCYSLDWGWLLLPQRGQLFGKGAFGTSDINNHVVGLYNDILIQIYTYSEQPQGGHGDQYLIAQIQLPKSYGDILVRRKEGFASKWFGVRGLDRIEMEWTEFNKKYEVFSSTGEGPSSCELLQPVFMETLEAVLFEVNLEVVDNVVYFYTKESGLQAGHYPIMLSILQEAFKQMKM